MFAFGTDQILWLRSSDCKFILVKIFIIDSLAPWNITTTDCKVMPAI